MMRCRLLAMVSLSWCCLVGTGSVIAEDWPRFRGPNGTGISKEVGLPTSIQKSDILWKISVPGVGHSSPIVSKGKIFLQSSSEDQKERMLLCFEAASGRNLWTVPIPGGIAQTHAKNSPASSTPATDGERVYAIFWNGQLVTLHAFDYQGKSLWQTGIGPYKSQHGVGLSPIVVDNKVVLNFDQDGAAQVLAFDAATGKRLWGSERWAYRACYSTPFVLDRPEGGSEIVVASTAGVSGYDPNTGKENWKYTWSFPGMALRTVGSPIASHGLIFAVSGDGGGSRNMIAVKAGGRGDVTETHLAWKLTKATAYVPTPLAWGEYLYWVDDKGIAACHEAKTGKHVWSERLGAGVTASPILVDGKVYAIDERGGIFVFAAAPQFNLLGKGSIGEEVYASPAVADGKLYIRGKNHLFCIGAKAK